MTSCSTSAPQAEGEYVLSYAFILFAKITINADNQAYNLYIMEKGRKGK